jgi:protein-S-isoprenylcysteine O-methyltransferase Ste14
LRPLPFAGDQAYAILFWSACAFWILPEVVAARVRRSGGTAKAQDQGSLNLIAALWLFGIVLDVWLSFSLPHASILWERDVVFFAGVGLMIGGAAFRWYSASLLGKYFTFDVATHSGQTIVERGPYRYIRHPSYTGALLSSIGFGLAMGNWAGLLAGVSCLCAAYAYRIPVEERALVSALGEPYQQYLKRTWRLVPFLF